MRRHLSLAGCAAGLAILAACAPDYSANTYASRAVQQANKVEQGVIVGVRRVDVAADGAAGAVTGSAAGGIAGSQTPGGGVAQAFGALGGALVGGLVGSAVEHTAGAEQAYEYIVREGKGDMVSVTQQDRAPLAVGQRVLVIAGAQARIVPDYTVPLPSPPAAVAAPGQPAPLAPAPGAAAPAPGSTVPDGTAIPPPAPITAEPLAAPPMPATPASSTGPNSGPGAGPVP